MPTNIPTMDPQDPTESYQKKYREAAFFFAISFAITVIGVALLMYLLLRKYSRRHQADVQQVSIPMNPLTHRNELEANMRTEAFPVAGPSKALGIFNATANLSPETATTIKDAEFLRPFELEKEHTKKVMGKEQLTDLEVTACRCKALGTTNSRKTQEEIDRRTKMSKKTQDEIKEKEGLRAEAAKMVGEDPFDDKHEVPEVNGEGQSGDEEHRVAKAGEVSNKY